jgi:hypothetical protein
MPTHCSATGMAFGRVGGRDVVAEFDGGRVTSLRALLSRTEYGYNDPLGLELIDDYQPRLVPREVVEIKLPRHTNRVA